MVNLILIFRISYSFLFNAKMHVDNLEIFYSLFIFYNRPPPGYDELPVMFLLGRFGNNMCKIRMTINELTSNSI